MIIDFHCHVGKENSGEFGESLSFDELKKSMDKWSIDKSVVFPFNCKDDELINESIRILEESKKRDWIIPFLRFNPLEINEEELIDLLDKGFKGIKLHPHAQEFAIDDPRVFWVYELCIERKLPILFHSSYKDDKYSHPLRLLRMVDRFPELIVVIAHFFGGDFNLMEIGKNYPNLYADTSISSGTFRRGLAVNKYGFKNLIFASDVPYDNQGVALLKINESNISDEDKELIFHKNAEKILNL